MRNFLLSAVCILIIQTTNAQSPSFEWAKGFYSSWFDEGRCIDIDGSGNVYVSGNLYGTTDFDPGVGVYNLTSAGGNDVFVAKYNALGNLIWAKQMSSPGGQDLSYSMNVDSIGNVYTTGVFCGIMDFDPGASSYLLTPNSFRSLFVSKLDYNGNFVWAKQICKTFLPSLTIDGKGNILITGNCNDTTDLDPGLGVFQFGTSSAVSSLFILKLDHNGNFVWAKRSLTTSASFQYCIKTDIYDNVYTTGYFNATTDFDPSASIYNLTPIGNNDIFISKLDSLGNFIWAKQFGGTNNDAGTAISIDHIGNIYATGYFSSIVDFDPGPAIFNLTPYGLNDIFMVKLNASGNFICAKQIGGTNIEFAQSLTLDASSNIYSTGYFKGTSDFDPSSSAFNLTSSGGQDVFVSKLDSSGNFLWAKKMGGIYNDWGSSISLDASSNIYTAGNFYDNVDFDPNAGVFNLNTDTIIGSFFIQKMSQATVGLKENEMFNNISIYPNPTSQFLNIVSNSSIINKMQLQILNSLGQIVFNDEICTTNSKINIENYPSGMYFIKLIQKDKQQTFKIIKS